MKLEDFYQAIRTKEEPKDFNEIKEFIDPGTFQTKGRGTISHGTHYHLYNFSKHGNQGLKVNWNFAAFFLTFYWFIYRRMYAFALALLPLHIFVKWMDGFSEIPALIIGLGSSIFFGLFGNSIYYWNVERRYKKGLSSKAATFLLWTCIFIELVYAFVTEIFPEYSNFSL